jgi:uncharacterized repeat protein (TIGR03803 family)
MKACSAWKVALVLIAMCAAFAVSSSAQTLTTIYDFCSQGGTNCTDGAVPWGGLVQGSDGNFYGTTSDEDEPGYGSVYKLTASGALTVLHSFTGLSDGGRPLAGLIQASDGNFYGVTTLGGGASGCGTVFRVTPSGTLTTLYDFAGAPNDGCQPFGTLVQASDGNLYGTTYLGGSNGSFCNNGSFGCGTIFKVTTGGSETNLYNFCTQSGCPDGASPQAGLVQGSDGNLYGVALVGGANTYGSVFKITTSGTLTVLHSFTFSDGSEPTGTLVQGRDGNFYGTTSQGGTAGGQAGTIFKMTPSGTLTTLYNFCPLSNCRNGGGGPNAGLVQASDGNFYGTTVGGGANASGVAFAITSSGDFSPLYSFCSLGGTNCTDGAYPEAGLIQASDGKLYGVTSEGGNASFAGTAFSLQINEDTLTVSIAGQGTVTSTDGFINCPGTCSHIYPTNTPVTLNASAASGWTFTTWGGACSGNGACNVTMSQNQSVSATFTQLSYTLSVSATGSGSVTSSDGFINCPGTCTHSYLSNTVVTLNANPEQGWSLNTWGGACSGNTSPCTVTMTGPESVSATFTQNSYTLTVTISGEGTVTSTDGFINCPGSCTHTYLSLTQVTLNAAANQGWNFQGWSGACSGVGPCALTMLGNYGVSAYFNQPGNGLHFSAITPCRLVDTRTGNGGGGPIPGGTYQTFNLPQLSQTKGCADLSSAASYSLNVTLVPQNHHPVSYLTIWPAGLAQPLISTMNSLDGRIKANAAIVPAGVSSAVSVYVTNTTDVVIDIDGFFAPAGQSTLLFYPLTPCRVADTRKSNFPQGLGQPHLSAGVARDFPVLNAAACNIPASAQAYSLNFTAIPYPALGDQLGYLEVWPKGQQPAHPVSTLNNPTGTYVANGAIVPAGTGGEITAYAASDTDVAIDINGYFAASGEGGMSLYPTAPCRVIDTRKIGNGQPFTGTLTPPVNVVDSVCAPPASAQAYVFNATVVPSGYLGYLTLWPDSEGQPVVSTLNAADGWITSNMAIVPNVNGKIDAYADGLTQLILDISSYFAP